MPQPRSPRDQQPGKRISAQAIRDLAREGDQARQSMDYRTKFIGQGGAGGPNPLDGWFPATVTYANGSGSSARYSFQPEAVAANGTVGNFPGFVPGDVTTSPPTFPGVNLFPVSGDFSAGDPVLARPAPWAGGTLYELIAVGSNGNGTGAAQDCGAFAGANANTCLYANTIASGNCSGVGNQSLFLRYDSDLTYWAANITIGGPAAGNTTINFTPGNASTLGQPLAWLQNFTADDTTAIPSQYLSLSDCSAGNLTYKGGGLPICDDDGGEHCPSDQYAITIACRVCGNANYTGPGWYCVAPFGECGDTANLTTANYTSDPGAGPTLCSGPYPDQATAQETCPPSTFSCDDTGDVIPTILFGTISNATGLAAGLNGTVVTLLFNGVSLWCGCVDYIDPLPGAHKAFSIVMGCPSEVGIIEFGSVTYFAVCADVAGDHCSGSTSNVGNYTNPPFHATITGFAIDIATTIDLDVTE